MAYASNTDIALEFKNIDFTNGAVKAATVDTWCAQASGIIDAYIGGRYTTPVDSTACPKAFQMLQMLCIQMVAFRVRKVTASTTGDSKSAQGAGFEGTWPKDVMDTLKSVQSGAMTLLDATLATTEDGVKSYTNDNSSDVTPTFTRSGNNW